MGKMIYGFVSKMPLHFTLECPSVLYSRDHQSLPIVAVIMRQ